METKKKYITPCLELIPLDNEISLALESSAPEGPGEGIGFYMNNPFKDEVGLV
jgi:hypothetical protein